MVLRLGKWQREWKQKIGDEVGSALECGDKNLHKISREINEFVQRSNFEKTLIQQTW
jgi:hypothetical protein